MNFGCGMVVIGMVGLPFLVPAIHALILPAINGRRLLLSLSILSSISLGVFGMLAVAETFPHCWSGGIDSEARWLAIIVSTAFYFLSALHCRLPSLLNEAWRG